MMFVSRLLLPTALVLTPWLSACSWGQNYTAMQAAYGGAVPAARRQFSLSNQATRPPLFADQQVNEYTAMSPNSWGHSATRQNLPPTSSAAPSYVTSNHVNTPPIFDVPDITPTLEMVLKESTEQPAREQNSVLVSEQQSDFAPLTNTGDSRAERQLSSSTDSATASLPKRSDDQQPSKTASDRYAQAQDFPFDGPGASILKNGGESLFPFTRKEPVSPVVPTDLPDGSALSVIQRAEDISGEALLPTSPPVNLGPQDATFPTSSPRTVSPVLQSPQIQTQQFQQSNVIAEPYIGQQPFQQQAPVLNQNQSAYGFDYPNELTSPVGEWQHPDGGANFQQGSRQQIPNWTSMVQTQQPTQYAPSDQQALPNFRPDLGHRGAIPTVRRNPILDDGKKFDHEKKKVDYPPFAEIIATGKFFYNAEVNVLRPSFLGNTGLSVDGAGFSESQPFEFANTYAPLVKFGFESQYGPGVELSYFNLTENANTLGATNNGSGSVASIASVTGPGRFSRIGADNVGETLTADHSFEMETIGINFFKELKFPISRLNGKFGFLYANVAQSLLVEVNDAADALVGELTSTTDFRGYGPQFALEYFRPVGHTPLTLVTSFGGKGLFGRRDQFVSNDAGAVERRFGADEFITVIDFAGGVQLKKMVGDGRYWTARVGYLHQTWLGGGTAVDPQGDFGISGFTFGVGYNR